VRLTRADRALLASLSRSLAFVNQETRTLDPIDPDPGARVCADRKRVPIRIALVEESGFVVKKGRKGYGSSRPRLGAFVLR
jgi:hypothetical protein